MSHGLIRGGPTPLPGPPCILHTVQKCLQPQFTFPVSQRAAPEDWKPWQRPDATQSSAAAASTTVTLSRGGPHTAAGLHMVTAGGQARTSPSGPAAPGTYQNRCSVTPLVPLAVSTERLASCCTESHFRCCSAGRSFLPSDSTTTLLRRTGNKTDIHSPDK